MSGGVVLAGVPVVRFRKVGVGQDPWIVMVEQPTPRLERRKRRRTTTILQILSYETSLLLIGLNGLHDRGSLEQAAKKTLRTASVFCLINRGVLNFVTVTLSRIRKRSDFERLTNR